MIKDRNGAPLAVSTPVESIAINPRELKTDDKNQADSTGKGVQSISRIWRS
jgi:cell division protein FtsI/penicillin-binding protein 2